MSGSFLMFQTGEGGDVSRLQPLRLAQIVKTAILVGKRNRNAVHGESRDRKVTARLSLNPKRQKKRQGAKTAKATQRFSPINKFEIAKLPPDYALFPGCVLDASRRGNFLCLLRVLCVKKFAQQLLPFVARRRYRRKLGEKFFWDIDRLKRKIRPRTGADLADKKMGLGLICELAVPCTKLTESAPIGVIRSQIRRDGFMENTSRTRHP